MCGFCGAFGNEEHWSSGTGVKGTSNLEERRASRERIQLINNVLSHYHLNATAWHNTSYLIQGSTGKQTVVNSLSGIWSEAEILCNENIDPLDPYLLRRVVGLDG